MRADTTITAGTVIEIGQRTVGGAKRVAEVIEVLGEGEHTHYRVRWEDGHESIYFPSSDATVKPMLSARKPR